MDNSLVFESCESRQNILERNATEGRFLPSNSLRESISSIGSSVSLGSSCYYTSNDAFEEGFSLSSDEVFIEDSKVYYRRGSQDTCRLPNMPSKMLLEEEFSINDIWMDDLYEDDFWINDFWMDDSFKCLSNMEFFLLSNLKSLDTIQRRQPESMKNRNLNEILNQKLSYEDEYSDEEHIIGMNNSDDSGCDVFKSSGASSILSRKNDYSFGRFYESDLSYELYSD